MEINVSLAELEAALKKRRSKRTIASVVVNKTRVSGLRAPGVRLWFEYHCLESHQSSDAKAWYRSHQQVEVLGFAKCDPAAFTTFNERGEAGHQLLYNVKFDDGLEYDVFEDELLDSPEEFERPDPPKERSNDPYGILEVVKKLAQVPNPHPAIYTLAEYVAKNGCIWTPAPLPRDIKRGAIKQCFRNALELSLKKGKYVEGFAFSSPNLPIPVHHAWCACGDTVIDNTWRNVGVAYLGIAYEPNWVVKQLANDAGQCSLLDNWKAGWPLLQKKVGG